MNIVKFTIHSIILIITLCVLLLIVLSRFRARWKDRLKANTLVELRDIAFEEKRQNPRLNLNIPVIIDPLEKKVEAETKDVTNIGAFIICKDPLPVKETFRIKFLFPAHNPLVFDAEVVWSNSNFPESMIVHRGMGIRFIKPSDESREFLKGVLAEGQS
jgi:hypothetical protein